MDVEAIQSKIRAILPLLRSTCDIVHCLGERVLFFFICYRFFAISFLNAPITLFLKAIDE